MNDSQDDDQREEELLDNDLLEGGSASNEGDASDAAADAWNEQKSAWMEELLGPEHDMVMHAIIPYFLGGGLDLYYYPNGVTGIHCVTGTGIATKELSTLPGDGSSNKIFQNYEMVMYTKETLDLDLAKDASTPFGAMHDTINRFLNMMAPYSAEASLNPHETCEFPEDMEDVGGRCLIFDYYGATSEEFPAEFGLLLLIEIFRSEMAYARENGGDALIKLLQEHGHYPYSDLDREPVA